MAGDVRPTVQPASRDVRVPTCGVLKKVDSRTGTNHSYMSHPLSHSELLSIIEEYLSSDLTKYATEKKYGLYQGCITYWLRTFGLDDKPKNEDMHIPPLSATVR